MQLHRQNEPVHPGLFYVSYQAGHAPLQPTAATVHSDECRSFSNPSRQAFCGLVQVSLGQSQSLAQGQGHVEQDQGQRGSICILILLCNQKIANMFAVHP